MLPRPVLGRRARAPDRSARPPPDHAPRAPAYLLQPVNVSVHRRWAIEKGIIIIVRPLIGLIGRVLRTDACLVGACRVQVSKLYQCV